MGERADTKVFYNDQEKCVVEAFFDVAKYDLQEFFQRPRTGLRQRSGHPAGAFPAGKSRAFVNDTPVNNQVLQRLTEALIDLHQQFDTLDIHNVNFQLRMIDALADNQGRLKEYQRGYRQYSADKRRLAELVARSENAAREMEFLRFQLDELQNAGLVAGEQELLEAELVQLTNAEDIKRVYGLAYTHLLDSEQNLIGQLQELCRGMAVTRRISTALGSVSERLEAGIVELQDIAKECERIAENTEHDPARIQEVQDRLNVVFKLQKKHGVPSVDELLTLQADLEGSSAGFTDLGEEIAGLEAGLLNRKRDCARPPRPSANAAAA